MIEKWEKRHKDKNTIRQTGNYIENKNFFAYRTIKYVPHKIISITYKVILFIIMSE